MRPALGYPNDFRKNTVVEFLRGAPARVARCLLAGGPATAGSLAAELELTPAAVRRHLDDLLSAGLVVCSERPPYGPRPRPGGRGRPAKFYSLTQAGRDRFDQAYDDVAVAALHYLDDQLGEAGVAEFARRRAAEIGRRYLAQLSPAEDPAAALAGALTADGYAATVVPVTGGIQLCQHHCPILHVARDFPAFCEAETEVLGQLLGTHVMRLATLAHGDGVCTTHIPRQPARSQQMVAGSPISELVPAGSREGRQ